MLNNKKLKTYGFFIIVILAALSLGFSNLPKKQDLVERPATYLLTEKQSQLGTHFLDESLGKSTLEIKNKNPNLKEVTSHVTSTGYIYSYLRDEKNIPVEIMSDSKGEAIAIIRSPVTGFEEKQESLRQQLGLGEPEVTMYPVAASVAIINVYPKEGIAIYFEKEFDRVEYIITFKSMSLSEFQQVFADKYQNTRNKKAN